MTVQKPNDYIRNFKAGKLKNDLSYCIIQDTNIDYCSMSCSVGVGSYSDPIEYQGMAHFLEHMLFLGSKRYPDENHFDKKLSENGGNSNAYTSFFETNYYFKCNNNSKEKIIDIFSRFFIDPLFNEDMVGREINAINSEHLKNINNDFWLKRQIIFNLSDEDSGINFFSTGNLETLQKSGVRDKMKEFYDKYYCSNNIKLSIVSPDDLVKTEEMIENIFSQVPKKRSSEIKLKRNNKYSEKKKMEIQLFPVNSSEDCNIYYFWNIDFLDKYKSNKNIYILSDLIDSTNKNSLSVYLSKNGYAYDVSTIIYEEGVFVLNVNVNKNKYEDIKKIIMEINNYIKFYLNQLMDIDVNKLYDYYNKKYNNIYQFSGKEDPIDLVQELSVNMLHYSEENYYNGDKIILEKDIVNLKSLIQSLNFNNINTLYYYHKDLNTINKTVDPYYKATYAELNESLYNDQSKEFKVEFILDNPYFDLNPKIIKDLDEFMVPTLILPNVWYGGISKYNEYDVYGKLIFSSNKLFDTIENYVYLSISITVINYYLKLKFDNISELHFNTYFSINDTYKNINLNIHGLNDKYNLFFNDIFDYLKQIKSEVEDNIIVNIIHNYIKNLKQIDRLAPSFYFNYVIMKQLSKEINHSTILASIKKLIGNMETFIENVKRKISEVIVFNDTSLKIFFYGNITEEYIKNIIGKDILKKPLENQTIKNKSNNNLIKSITMKHPNPNEDNNVVLFSFYCCKFDPNKLVMLKLIQNSMKSKVYHFLRTKNQLGYSVGSKIYEYKNDYYLFIFVQSPKEVKLIKDKMNEFVDIFKSEIKKEIKEKFKSMKKDLYERLLEKKNNIYEKYSFYLDEIIRKRYIFNHHLILADRINSIKDEDICEYIDNIFNNKEVIIIN